MTADEPRNHPAGEAMGPVHSDFEFERLLVRAPRQVVRLLYQGNTPVEAVDKVLSEPFRGKPLDAYQRRVVEQAAGYGVSQFEERQALGLTQDDPFPELEDDNDTLDMADHITRAELDANLREVRADMRVNSEVMRRVLAPTGN